MNGSVQMIYKRKVFYYETDKMAIVHHSNYIRWMEEARVEYLDKVGTPFDKMEELGLVCPVLGVNAEYVGMVRFGDTVTIDVRLTEFKGVKMIVRYTMYKEDGSVCFRGESRHCFMKDGKIVNVRKKFPEIYEKMISELDTSEDREVKTK